MSKLKVSKNFIKMLEKEFVYTKNKLNSIENEVYNLGYDYDELNEIKEKTDGMIQLCKSAYYRGRKEMLDNLCKALNLKVHINSHKPIKGHYFKRIQVILIPNDSKDLD